MINALKFLMIGALIALTACSPGKPSRVDFGEWIKDHEKDLLAHAEAVLQGRIKAQEGRVSYPPPAIHGPKPLRVEYVTKDANDNVYFVTNESFTTFNVGFVLKSGNLLGDGCEPRLTETRHLFGRWWFYRAS